MSTSSVNTLPKTEETLAQILKLYSSRDYDCVIASPLKTPYLVKDTVVFPLQGIPEKVEEALTISGRHKHSDFVGEVAHLVAHLRFKDMQGQILELDDPVESLAWYLEDARTTKDHLTRREMDTLLMKTRFQRFLTEFSHLANPTSFDYLTVWSAICSRAAIGLVTKEEKTELRHRVKSKLSPQVLDDAEALVEEIVEMEVGDEMYGRRCIQIARLVPECELSAPLHRQCVLDPRDEVDGGGAGGEGTDSEDKEEDDVSDTEKTEEGLDSDEDPNATPENTDEDVDREEQETSSEEVPQQSSEKEVQEDKEDTDETTEDWSDSLDVADDEEPNLDIPEFKSEQRKEREEMAALDNSALRNMEKVGLDKKGIKIPTRPSTQADVQLASKLAVTFRKARWRAPKKVIKRSATPPGKLVPRAAVFSAAQRSMGLPVTAEPFRQTFKKREEGPPIILGLMCDVSGSMSASADPMAQFAWACSRAVPKAGGEFAAVTFGRTVKTLVPLNSRLNAIPRFATKDGYEAGHSAMLALAGGLGFFRRKEGVKVLLISSDAFWQYQEVDKSTQVLKSLQKMGVMVLWLPFDRTADDWKKTHGAQGYVSPLMQYGRVVRFARMEDAPKELGKLIEEEARKA